MHCRFQVRTSLLLTSAVAAFVAVAPAPAMAACVNTTANDIECTGANPNTPINNSGQGTRTVTVTQGASVTSGQNTVVSQGTSGQIVNDGRIETDSSSGAAAQSAAIAIGNTGEARITNNAGATIIADGVNTISARMLATGSRAVLVNQGTITATGSASGNGFGAIAALINASSSDALVTNSGQISGAAVGIGIDHSGTGETFVSNTSAGTITGGQTGLFVRNARGPVQIDNAGTINRTDTGTGGFFNAGIYIIDQSPQATGTQVIINNSGTISGGGSNAITAIQNANGTLEINNSGTIIGNILRSSAGLGALIDNSGTINGDVVLSFGEDTIIMRGADAAINGGLDGGFDNDTLRFVDVDDLLFTANQQTFRFENIFLDSGSLRLNSAMFETFGTEGAGVFTTQAGSTLTLTGGQSSILFADGGVTTINGLLVVDRLARLSLTAGAGLSHDFVAASGSTTRFILDSVSGSTSFNGQIRATNITFASGSQIDLDVRDLNLLVNGRTFDIAVATNSLTDASGAITDNSVLFDFTKAVVGGNTLRVTMQQLLSIADTINPADPNSAALAGGLQGLIDSGSPSGNAVSTLLGGFSTVDDLSAAVADFAPDGSNMVALAAVDMVEPVFDSVRERAASHAVTNGDVQFWLAGGLFGSERNPRGGQTGFEADGSHYAAGAEARLGGAGALVLGLAFDHASGDGHAGVSRADLKADRLYAYAFLPAGPLHLNAAFGLGWGKARSQRNIAVLGETATGRADLDTTFGRVELGYDLGKGAFRITPLAGLQFADVTVGAFDETGSDGALRYGERKVKSARADLGLGLGWSGGKDGQPAWSLTGALRYASQLRDLDTPLRAQFTGGGNAFDWSVADIPESSWEAEAGARAHIGRFGTVSATYRGSFASGAESHAGLFTLSMGF